MSDTAGTAWLTRWMVGGEGRRAEWCPSDAQAGRRDANRCDGGDDMVSYTHLTPLYQAAVDELEALSNGPEGAATEALKHAVKPRAAAAVEGWVLRALPARPKSVHSGTDAPRWTLLHAAHKHGARTTALHEACVHHQDTMVDRLLFLGERWGFDKDSVTAESKYTPAHIAAQNGDANILRKLGEKNAALDRVDSKVNTLTLTLTLTLTSHCEPTLGQHTAALCMWCAIPVRCTG